MVETPLIVAVTSVICFILAVAGVWTQSGPLLHELPWVQAVGAQDGVEVRIAGGVAMVLGNVRVLEDGSTTQPAFVRSTSHVVSWADSDACPDGTLCSACAAVVHDTQLAMSLAAVATVAAVFLAARCAASEPAASSRTTRSFAGVASAVASLALAIATTHFRNGCGSGRVSMFDGLPIDAEVTLGCGWRFAVFASLLHAVAACCHLLRPEQTRKQRVPLPLYDQLLRNEAAAARPAQPLYPDHVTATPVTGQPKFHPSVSKGQSPVSALVRVPGMLASVPGRVIRRPRGNDPAFVHGSSAGAEGAGPNAAVAASTKPTSGPRQGLLRRRRDVQASAVAVSEPALAGVTTFPPVEPIAAHPAFEPMSTDILHEVKARTTLYRHKQTGAEVLSLEAPDDDNKVFGITFRTPVDNSMGIPHILEHSVLCGSRKYPIKDPFVEMMKGSLNTFLNAMTWPDRTCYPVASQNTKDFYNLTNVYLDAVLHPRAIDDPMTLQQEGWHLELEDLDGPLQYKGVVFNEMKGVYSQPESLLGKLEQQALFPDTTYSHDSGGDPLDIPNLTFDEFRAFHDRYYHPANSRIYFYGDDNPTERLNLLDQYLKEFGPLPDAPVKSKIDWQPLWSKPRRAEGTYPVRADQDAKRYVSTNWLINEEPMSEHDVLAFEVLNDLLLGSSTAFLQKALTDSGLGTAVVGGGFDHSVKQAVFSVGLQGMANEPGSTDALEKLVLDTLQTVASDGFPEAAVEACVTQLEFALREFNTGGTPKGLLLLFNANRDWVHDMDPIAPLKFEKQLNNLKAELATGKPVFEDLIRKKLLSNKHRATCTLVPDTEMEKVMQAKEEATLAAIRAEMSEDDLKQVIEATKVLQERQLAQDTEEDIAKMPTLSVADRAASVKEVPSVVERRADGVQVITHDLATSGILYTDMVVDVSHLSLKELADLQLLTNMITEFGTKEMDRVDFDRYVRTRIGSLSSSVMVQEPISQNAKGDMLVNEDDAVLTHLLVRSKAVTDRVPDMMDIITMVLRDANLDQRQRVSEMLLESKAALEASIVGSGHMYAGMSVGGAMTLQSYMSERLSGIPALERVKDRLAQVDTDEGWATLLSDLEALRAKVLSTPKDKVTLNLTGEKAVLEASAPTVDEFLQQLPIAGTDPVTSRHAEWTSEWRASASSPLREGLIVPTQVNYVAKGARLFEPGEKVSSSSVVIDKFLRTGYLWDTVRVVGGAYGAGSSFNRINGTIRMSSYRDPNLAKTIDAYNKSGQHLIDNAPSDKELEQAIIGAFGDIDRPRSADQKGFQSMVMTLTGDTYKRQQRSRNQIMKTSVKDFKEFGRRITKAFSSEDKYHVSTIASEAALEASDASDLGLKTWNPLSSSSSESEAAGVTARVEQKPAPRVARKAMVLEPTRLRTRRALDHVAQAPPSSSSSSASGRVAFLKQ